MNRTATGWWVTALAGFMVLPWYAQFDGFWSFEWLSRSYLTDPETAPLVFLLATGEAPWLWPLPIFLLATVPALFVDRRHALFRRCLLIAAGAGVAYAFAQGFAIGIGGWQFDWLTALFDPLDTGQFGMGYGALLAVGGLFFLYTIGLAARGAVNGDVFVVGSIGLIVAVVGLFILFPILQVLASAVQDNDGNLALGVFVEKLTSDKIWGLACLSGNRACGSAWNSLALAIAVGAGSTLLGLAFALVVTRTGFPAKRLFRALTVLPIITPPFVIGLALILIFGQSGAVSTFLEWAFDVQPGRWLYGFFGVWFAQMLAFTPIAFLVLIGVVEGVSPSMEEAAQTLRADGWTTFTTVSLPLMRPGLANAFLLGFIESMADFGNPMVLGGNFEVLSTEIFFAIVGAQYDQGRAAVLALVLLFFTLSAFYAQRRWLGRRAYTTVTGKGDAGIPVPLPPRLNLMVLGTTVPWAVLTAAIYLTILFGGFVETWGLNHSFTLRHYLDAFRRHHRRARLGVERRGVEFILYDGNHRRGVGTADRRPRPVDRLSVGPPAVCLEGQLRIRDHAQLRDPRHGDWGELCPRLQCPAHRDYRHRGSAGGVLHLSQHAGGRAGRYCLHEPARQELGRGLAHPGRQYLGDHSQSGLAIASAGHRGRGGLQLRPRDDRD